MIGGTVTRDTLKKQSQTGDLLRGASERGLITAGRMSRDEMRDFNSREPRRVPEIVRYAHLSATAA